MSRRGRSWIVVIWMGSLMAMMAGPCAEIKAQPQESVKLTNQQEAIRLWELAVLAKGGRGKLYQITNFVVISGNPKRYDWRAHKHALFMEELYVLPDKFWRWADHPARIFAPICPSVDVYDGAQTTLMRQAGPKYEPKVKQGEAHFDVQLEQGTLAWTQLGFLMETRWLKPVPIASGRASIRDKWVDVVEAWAGIYRATYFLDTKTHLPIMVDIIRHMKDGSKEDVQTVWFTDYNHVDGLAMPKKVGPFEWWVFGPVSYEFNVVYDERIFRELPRIENGPEAWRAKAK